MYAFAPEKTPSLVGRNFCLAMALQKVRPTALRYFSRTSTYTMYAFAPEKTPSLVGRNFCLAMASQKVRCLRFMSPGGDMSPLRGKAVFPRCSERKAA
jgi:hypothetical protein